MPVLGKLVRKKFSAQNIFDSKEATVDQQLKLFIYLFYFFINLSWNFSTRASLTDIHITLKPGVVKLSWQF